MLALEISRRKGEKKNGGLCFLWGVEGRGGVEGALCSFKLWVFRPAPSPLNHQMTSGVLLSSLKEKGGGPFFFLFCSGALSGAAGQHQSPGLEEG